LVKNQQLKQAPRQWSADSGIDFLERVKKSSITQNTPIKISYDLLKRSSSTTINDQAFILPPRITAYPE